MGTLRVAAAQLALVDGDYSANLARIAGVVASHGPDHDLLVLPETATSGFASRDDVERLAEPLDGPTVGQLRRWSAEHSLTIACGLVERSADRCFNTAVVVSDGDLVLTYRKTQLWLGDRGKFDAGTDYRCIPWRGTSLGALICFDIEFPETARAVAALGARVLAVCNGNMVPYRPVHRVLATARALENQIFVVMANRVGPGRDEVFAGGSLIADPDGTVLAEADGATETVLSAEIDLEQLERSRADYDYLALRRVRLPGESEAIARACWPIPDPCP